MFTYRYAYLYRSPLIIILKLPSTAAVTAAQIRIAFSAAFYKHAILYSILYII